MSYFIYQNRNRTARRTNKREDGVLMRTGFVAAIVMVILFSSEALAQSQKVLFFEEAMAPTDTLFSTDPSGYSKLAELLRNDGMLVASMSSSEITREKLAPYEIVVLHSSTERPLQEPEISALVWYVTQKGGALFVNGGSAKVVNPLTEIFGISMNASNLVNAASSLDKTTAGHTFLLDRFPRPPGFELGDIKNIGFYGGAPLSLSKDAVAVVTGDENCYSDDGVYSIGSLPPVAAVAYVGRGVVLVKSDRAMLSNANIDAYQNKDWATAMFERLVSAQETVVDRDKSLFSMRSRVNELEQSLADSAEKIKKYETDLADSYGKIKGLEGNLQESQHNNENLTAQVKRLEDERDRLTMRLARYDNPQNRRIFAAVVGGTLLVIFFIGLLVGRRSVRSRKSKYPASEM